MRLTEVQRKTILKTVKLLLGVEAQVILFGSRVIDTEKGGDIDILVETKAPIDNPAEVIASIAAKLLIAFEGKKVDVLLSAPNLDDLPIHKIARKNGIYL